MPQDLTIALNLWLSSAIAYVGHKINDDHACYTIATDSITTALKTIPSQDRVFGRYLLFYLNLGIRKHYRNYAKRLRIGKKWPNAVCPIYYGFYNEESDQYDCLDTVDHWQDLDRSEWLTHLLQATALTKEEQQIVECFLSGYEVKIIAQILHQDLPVVQKRWRQLIKKLRDQLKNFDVNS